MTDAEAAQLVGILVGATTGWNDEAVVIYAAEFQTHSDAQAMSSAIRHVIRTWTEARRPPLGVILDAYRAEVARRQPSPTREIGGRRVPFDEGIEIARRAYLAECRTLGKRPNERLFDRLIARVPQQ